MLNNKEVKERLMTFRKDYPISLAEITRIIGLGNKRYVLSDYVRGKCNLYDDTLKALDDYLVNKGY